MKRTLFLISKIIFLYLIILSNSFADSHIKIIKLNKPIDHCYGRGSTNTCNKVEFHVFADSPPSFIIADNISLNQSWSELISNHKCIFPKNSGLNGMIVECSIDSERFVKYIFYLPQPNFIITAGIYYHTCSNNDKEKITESLISKFKKNQMVSQLNPNDNFLLISDKGSQLNAELFEGNYPLAYAQTTLRCPGDVRLILKLNNPLDTKDVNHAVRKFISHDSKKSTPKF